MNVTAVIDGMPGSNILGQAVERYYCDPYAQATYLQGATGRGDPQRHGSPRHPSLSLSGRRCSMNNRVRAMASFLVLGLAFGLMTIRGGDEKSSRAGVTANRATSLGTTGAGTRASRPSVKASPAALRRQVAALAESLRDKADEKAREEIAAAIEDLADELKLTTVGTQGVSRQFLAQKSLRAKGLAAIPQLLDALAEKRPVYVKQQALGIIWGIADKNGIPKQVVPVFVLACSDPEEKVRATAVAQIGAVARAYRRDGQQAELSEAVEYLLMALEDPAPIVRWISGVSLKSLNRMDLVPEELIKLGIGKESD